MLHQDNPDYGTFLKLIISLVPAVLAVTGVYLWLSGEPAGLPLLVEAFVIGLIFWLVFPRRYEVYDDHLSIALGGPFAVRVGFDQVASVEVTTRTALTANFVTRFAKTYVLIVKKRGLSIAITPKSNKLFASNANRALNEWMRKKGNNPPAGTASGIRTY